MAKDMNPAEMAAVVTDYENENGEHPVGKLVHLSSVSHAWRGVLKEVTSSYYILDGNKPFALVESTGPMGEYLSNPTAMREGDGYEPGKKGKKAHIRVPRGAVAWMVVFD
jgi:hypothetical protein